MDSVREALKAKVDKILQEGIENGVFPGASIIVGSSDKVIYHTAMGYACVDPERVAIKEDTIFDVASLTKPLATALAVMRLVHEKVLSLDDSLGDLIGGKVTHDKEGLTIRQLLAHTAGLPAWRPFFREIGYVGREGKEIIRRKVLETPLEYTPGTKVTYSDLGYILIEWAVEVVSGMSLPRFVFQYFYKPLGLKRTFFQEIDKPMSFAPKEFAATEKCPWRGRVIRGIVHDENAYAMGGVSGHAGLFSTAGEVFKLCAALLAHYYGKRSDLIEPSVVREFFTRQKDPEGNTWALGWDTPCPEGSAVGSSFSRNSVGHLGFTGTSVWMDLDKDTIVVFLTNRVHPTRHNNKIKTFRPYLHDSVANCLKGFSA